MIRQSSPKFIVKDADLNAFNVTKKNSIERKQGIEAWERWPQIHSFQVHGCDLFGSSSIPIVEITANKHGIIHMAISIQNGAHFLHLTEPAHHRQIQVGASHHQMMPLHIHLS